jgi:outer membrane murein-binding lipoprotein Lpp
VKKLITSAAVAALAVAALAGCTHSSNGNTAEYNQQQADTRSLEAAQPLPHFNYSQIRETIIAAETIEADGTQTTSFFFQMGDANPVFSCPSIGMPVSNTASLSNPSQPYNGPVTTDGGDVVGQMDPNGVYTPESSTGTYVICVNGGGQNYLQYWEGDVMTVAAEATWNASTHSMQVIGAPTAAIATKP